MEDSLWCAGKREQEGMNTLWPIYNIEITSIAIHYRVVSLGEIQSRCRKWWGAGVEGHGETVRPLFDSALYKDSPFILHRPRGNFCSM